MTSTVEGRPERAPIGNRTVFNQEPVRGREVPLAAANGNFHVRAGGDANRPNQATFRGHTVHAGYVGPVTEGNSRPVPPVMTIPTMVFTQAPNPYKRKAVALECPVPQPTRKTEKSVYTHHDSANLLGKIWFVVGAILAVLAVAVEAPALLAAGLTVAFLGGLMMITNPSHRHQHSIG